MTTEKVLEVFEKTGALLKGHFRLRSGLHSDCFLQTAVVLQYPEIAAQLCKELSNQIDNEVDVVIGPAIGGVIIAHEIAQELIARAIFGEKRNGEMILRPGFQINSGDRVLVVDDVLTTGGSVSKLIDLTQEQKGEVVAAAFLVDRSSTPIDFGIPQFCLAKIDAPTYHPKDCPMDKAGIPIVEP
ncbi:TPA: orotate phosphoribosyltransferase [Candidatus Poribacteria bacterium]|jgi:orotate phosphoribosyltransferase|nr:orotate phosphoribosyltransferase [Candidatus Poribacteria bacterium]HIA65779.1 orotate phosphoribosyltransferase [Candidatus Poribacteria bacterium]HIB98777.1 orotate phosphoribosyltransferase [Candidatus Poribacteria bacterium]HIC17961.1 orotate phosphoribosyltransferase [Candidatus Poribacteria bacterium]HIM11712.1 orotate phosphoribosyltransferase [Candidatus Poribacteria bacterium]